MNVYFEDEFGCVFAVKGDCPVTKGEELCFANDLLIGDKAEVHVGDGWRMGERCNPNKTMTFIVKVEVPDWIGPREAYGKINTALGAMVRAHHVTFASCTLSSPQPLDE